jgi:hypothetical protein
MDAIFDREGSPIAWRHRDAIFDNAGQPLAIVRARAVFSLAGQALGRFEDGFYRDLDGHAVAFEAGATGGPLPPVPHPTGAQPKWAELPREPALGAIPPAPRMRSRAWSQTTWDAFITGGTVTA